MLCYGLYRINLFFKKFLVNIALFYGIYGARNCSLRVYIDSWYKV